MLNINEISVRLGGRVILDRASAALPPSRVGLIGRNGAGKSTLMKIVAGLLEADEGAVEMPRGRRIGYIAQEAPAGTATPFETVLAADTERAALLARSRASHDPHRLGEIHERLNAIDAHAAPARAARILVGLGFDEAAQHQPLDSFSGGWRMRVALAGLLFSAPDLLLLDEPSNHLDLEATLWLENFLKILSRHHAVVSHERDLLNNVVDHILHCRAARRHSIPAAMTRSSGNAPSGSPSSNRRAPPRRRSAPSCRIISPATAPGRPPPSRRSRASRRWRGCSRSPRSPRIRACASTSRARPS